ncbi:hypothetical protein [Bradyrhizobium sp. DASA03007]|uniref:hypothetical protein n=1 Tax=unclassified Bradyrhizobium TaxID=2631580 RepID=UPI003F71174D
MPIVLTNFLDGSLLQGRSWTVRDETELAERIARVALGQSRHVAKILAGLNNAPPPSTKAARAAAIKLLTVPEGTETWHRDGWIFQTMSWLVATQASPSALTRAPHMILAHKGFDGLQLEVDQTTGRVSAAVIFEDKATSNPRQTITGEVWPEFKLLESGDRENVLTADVSALLCTRPDVDPDKAIENIIWKQVRHYRLSITVGSQDFTSDEGRKQLFKGYDDIAAGDVRRRRGEIFYVEKLRPWMKALAGKAISFLSSQELESV